MWSKATTRGACGCHRNGGRRTRRERQGSETNFVGRSTGRSTSCSSRMANPSSTIHAWRCNTSSLTDCPGLMVRGHSRTLAQARKAPPFRETPPRPLTSRLESVYSDVLSRDSASTVALVLCDRGCGSVSCRLLVGTCGRGSVVAGRLSGSNWRTGSVFRVRMATSRSGRCGDTCAPPRLGEHR
jgi:hypothetical protein